MQVIPKNTISFLKELKLNNNRDWFNKNKDQFKSIQADIKTFAQEVKDSLNLTDDIEKLKIFRIYRDLRFSKDTSPGLTSIEDSIILLRSYFLDSAEIIFSI